MASKSIINVNPLQPPVIDVEHNPLADKYFKINDTVIDFNLLELHCWSHDKFIDQADDILLCDSNLPKYIFPQTFQVLEIIRLCQVHYMPSERVLVTLSKEILFTITA